MPLSIVKRNGQDYLYFFMGASKRLYLGTRPDPKQERVEESRRYLIDKISEYERELRELDTLSGRWNELEKSTKELRYKIVFFDLDGVIFDKPWHEATHETVAISTWDLLFQKLGVYDVHEKLKQNFAKGVFKTYTEWTEAACNVLKSVGLDRKTFEAVINSRGLSPGAVEVFQRLQTERVKTAVVSGSFDALASRAKELLGNIDHAFAHCNLVFNSEGRLQDWKLEPADYLDKARFVEKVAKMHGIPLQECAYVGDDVNDLEAFKRVGLAIAFNARKAKVMQSADVVIDGQDLRAILVHLAVPRQIEVKAERPR